MHRIFQFLLFIGIGFLSQLTVAQTEMDSTFKSYRELSIRAHSDLEKTNYSDSLRTAVKSFLDFPGTFETPLGKIPYLGDVYSPDNAFRMITWNVSLKDETYDYYCFIQLAPNADGESQWFELLDNHKHTKRPETKSLNKSNWFGCLYYSIIPFKMDKKTSYVLLGWEGNNKFSNKKILECLSFNAKNEPRFDKTVFKSGRFNKRRVIFEYSKDAYFMLRYNEKLKMIVFNRLEPAKPELEGLYSYYQPTTTFDAYILKKEEWIVEEDVDPRNKKNNKIFIDPSKKKNKPKID